MSNPPREPKGAPNSTGGRFTRFKGGNISPEQTDRLKEETARTLDFSKMLQRTRVDEAAIAPLSDTSVLVVLAPQDEEQKAFIASTEQVEHALSQPDPYTVLANPYEVRRHYPARPGWHRLLEEIPALDDGAFACLEQDNVIEFVESSEWDGASFAISAWDGSVWTPEGPVPAPVPVAKYEGVDSERYDIPTATQILENHPWILSLELDTPHGAWDEHTGLSLLIRPDEEAYEKIRRWAESRNSANYRGTCSWGDIRNACFNGVPYTNNPDSAPGWAEWCPELGPDPLGLAPAYKGK